MPAKPSTSPRRPLRFGSLADVLTDVETLAAGPIEASGNWTPAQIVLHLAESIDRSIDGFGVKAPLASRLGARVGKSKFLRDGLPAGLKVGEGMQHLMPPDGATLEDAIARLRLATARLDRETMAADHPYLGRLTEAEWRELHCRHAELHLGFLTPST